MGKYSYILNYNTYFLIYFYYEKINLCSYRVFNDTGFFTNRKLCLFDGDGRNEIVAVSNLKAKPLSDTANPEKPWGEIYDLENERIVYQGFMFENNTTPIQKATPLPENPTPQPFVNPDRILITGDFDGDGITDFLYVPGGSPNGALFEFESNDSILELKKRFDYNDIRSDDLIGPVTTDIENGIRDNDLMGHYVTADFNGDGRTDLFNTLKKTVLLSDGKNFKSPFLMDDPNYSSGSGFKYDFVYPEDVDGDGKSDLVYASSTRTIVCFFIDDTNVAMETEMIDLPENCQPVQGKNNHNELILLNGDSIVRLSYGLNFAKDILLTGVKTGLGTVTDFEYSVIDSDGIYSQTKDMQFPYQNLDRHSIVASKMRTYNKDELLGVKTYTYENGVTHKQGLDFCGFEKITALDSIRNQSVIKTFDPLNYGILKQVESPAATTVNTYNVNIADNKIAKITLASSAQTDKLKNITVNKSYVYDDYGNATKETIDYGGDARQVTDNSYNNYDTETLYRLGEPASSTMTNYTHGDMTDEIADPGDIIGPGGTGVLPVNQFPGNNNTTYSTTTGGIYNKPGTSEANFGASVSVKTDILYNDKGLPINKTSYYNGNKAFEETSAYSISGDLLSLGAKPYNEISALGKTYEYDDYGRVTKETDPIDNTLEYTYDDNGLLKQTKDIYGNATNYEYDNFGRLKTTTSPFGSVTSVNYQWIDSETSPNVPDAAVYSVTTKTVNDMYETKEPGVEEGPGDTNFITYGAEIPGGGIKAGGDIAYGGGQTIVPETISYFDALGREIRSEQMRFDGSQLKIDKQYDARGRLWKVSAPFKGDAPTLWDIYSYDDFDRPTSILYASGKQDAWSYSENSVTSATDGVETTKTYNAAGQLIEAADAGGTITYSYRPDGKPEKIVTNGIKTSFTYDDYGRRLTIADPSAGTETLTYDSRGNIASYTDAKNQTTTFAYDDYYRLTAKQMPEYTVNYGYDAKNGLTGISSNGGQSTVNYTFDNYGRRTLEAETFEGKTLAKKYAYSNELLASKTYMLDNNTITIENLGYQNGYHTETRLNGSKSIWKITAENERGQTTAAMTGSFARTYGFDAFGMPTARKIQTGNAVIQNFSYNFDASTGNLLSRKDSIRGIVENFGYDNLNRLTDFGGSAAVYAGNGNISEKDDMLYSYDTPNKPYAVSGIDPGEMTDSNLISSAQQTIEYTSFKRPASISCNDTVYQFAYNGLDMRTKMFLSADTGKIYLGNCYEKDQNAGYTKEKLYLCDDYYTSPAVMVRENNGDWQLYYIGRDYLGSITNVASENGSVGYEYSYDAWGNLRNPDTQTLYAQDNQPDLFLGRGFTGHEHLPFCNLINMNARLYDPAAGRFLSPDPYVQGFDFSQGYNRYSYCLNNPLRYTDPTGEHTYRWDPDARLYRDEDGNSADFGDVYRDFFQRGYFRPGGSMWDGTSYRGFSGFDTGMPNYGFGGGGIYLGDNMWINGFGSGSYDDPFRLKEVVITARPVHTQMIKPLDINEYLDAAGRMQLNITDMGWTGVSSKIVGTFGLDFSITANLKQNSLFWRNAKGNFISTNILKQGANGKYVRGVQGLRNSFAIAEEAASTARLVGNGFAILGGLITVGDMIVNGINVSNSLDLTMTAVGFIPGVGWIISGTYFVADMVTELSTGQSIGQHAQNWVNSW